MSEEAVPYTVYRLYDADDRLLYVGCTAHRMSRIEQHESKAWWPEVAFVVVSHHPSRAAARRAEDDAIEAEDPVYNVRRPNGRGVSIDDMRAAAQRRVAEYRGGAA